MVTGGRARICRRRLRCSELTNLREIGSGHAPIGEWVIIISVDLCKTETLRQARAKQKQNKKKYRKFITRPPRGPTKGVADNKSLSTNNYIYMYMYMRRYMVPIYV